LSLTKSKQQLGRRHIIWQIVPSPWANNQKSQLKTFSSSLIIIFLMTKNRERSRYQRL